MKVSLMTQIIQQLEQQVEYERRKKEEALKREEDLRIRAEKYKELLKKHSIPLEENAKKKDLSRVIAESKKSVSVYSKKWKKYRKQREDLQEFFFDDETEES